MKRLSTMLLCAVLAAGATAKLPALSDEAKAKAAEAAAKAAHADKVAAFQLCQAMNRVAAGWQASVAKAGKAASAPTETPACTDPGPFVAATPAATAATAASAAAAAPTAVASATAATVAKQ